MENYEEQLNLACEKFRKVLEGQLKRVEMMKSQGDFVDYDSLDCIRIGVCGGDGIGPTISAQARRVLEFILSDLKEQGRVEFIDINGLTIENRIAHMKAIPDDVMAELKSCHIILKGPTTTPQRVTECPTSRARTSRCEKRLTCLRTFVPSKFPKKESTGRSSVKIRKAAMRLARRAST